MYIFFIVYEKRIGEHDEEIKRNFVFPFYATVGRRTANFESNPKSFRNFLSVKDREFLHERVYLLRDTQRVEII